MCEEVKRKKFYYRYIADTVEVNIDWIFKLMNRGERIIILRVLLRCRNGRFLIERNNSWLVADAQNFLIRRPVLMPCHFLVVLPQLKKFFLETH